MREKRATLGRDAVFYPEDRVEASKRAAYALSRYRLIAQGITEDGVSFNTLVDLLNDLKELFGTQDFERALLYGK